MILCGVHTPELEIAWLRKRDRKYRLAVVGCGQIGKLGALSFIFALLKIKLDFCSDLWFNIVVGWGRSPVKLRSCAV